MGFSKSFPVVRDFQDLLKRYAFSEHVQSLTLLRLSAYCASIGRRTTLGTTYNTNDSAVIAFEVETRVVPRPMLGSEAEQWGTPLPVNRRCV